MYKIRNALIKYKLKYYVFIFACKDRFRVKLKKLLQKSIYFFIIILYYKKNLYYK